MEENKNNYIQMDSLEQVAGGVDPPGVEKAEAEIAARQVALEGCAQAVDAALKESEDFLAKAIKMREEAEARRKKLNKVLNFLTFGQGTKWFGE